MTKADTQQENIFWVSSSPHLAEPATSKRVMFEVVIGCIPALIMAVVLFRGAAISHLLTCVVSAVLTEWVFNAVRKKPQTIDDGSAVVTALILALSLPPTLPLWMAAVGSIVAIAVAKMLFGGLGGNIFNPAMAGRAFLMACFGTMMATWSLPALTYQNPTAAAQQHPDNADAVTQPTPLALAKQPIKDAANQDKTVKATPNEANESLQAMFLGTVSGSLGETSALCWLIGGLFLLVRRTITYHIPLAVLATAGAIATFAWLFDSQVYANPLVHLCGGGLMMCAFFIATDPVSCPLTRTGRVLFGIGIGALIMLIRLKGGYPEGVMYAVLLMNALTPLLDRWTRPTPLGGHAREDT